MLVTKINKKTICTRKGRIYDLLILAEAKIRKFGVRRSETHEKSILTRFKNQNMDIFWKRQAFPVEIHVGSILAPTWA